MEYLRLFFFSPWLVLFLAMGGIVMTLLLVQGMLSTTSSGITLFFMFSGFTPVNILVIIASPGTIENNERDTGNVLLIGFSPSETLAYINVIARESIDRSNLINITT